MSLFADYNLPFLIALGVMLVLAILQFVGLGDFEFDADVDIDVAASDIDAGASGGAGFLGAITTLLGLGRVPLFVWLMLFLLLFAMVGMSVQEFASSLTGSPLYSWLAAIIAGGAVLPITSVLVRPLAHILPQDETSAVSLASLVGRRGTVTTGRAQRGSPARTKVYDIHGQAHHVMVEPHENASEMLEGDEILLVRREGQTFFGVPLADRKLSAMD